MQDNCINTDDTNHDKDLEEKIREYLVSLGHFITLTKISAALIKNPFATKEMLEYVGTLVGLQLLDASYKLKVLVDHHAVPVKSAE